MSESRFAFRECLSALCGFRYPVTDSASVLCPACGAQTRLAAERIQRREATRATESVAHRLRVPLFGLLDNVRSVFNTGSIFRSADGAGVGHLYLTGMTPTPEHSKFAKTALGAEARVGWSRSLNGVEKAAELRHEGMHLWALEDEPRAVSLFDCHLSGEEPIVLVIGNEMAGVDPGILELCDRVLAIPMWGMKQSLNVAVAFGIAVYWLRGTSR